MIITIKHQVEKTLHEFEVANPDNLTSFEVLAICTEMNVHALLVNGKYYSCK